MTTSALFIGALALAILAPVQSSLSKCTGNPPMFNGLPCASTTRYWDGQMGACGCGSGNTNPFSWQWTSYTAAASQPLFDDFNGGNSQWCGDGCGACYELTPTGDCPYTSPCSATQEPITIMITNRCPYIGNEAWCTNAGVPNSIGLYGHFDIMDYNMAGLVSALQWNNPVVTYRRVACGDQGSPSCSQAGTCECGTSLCSQGPSSSDSSSNSNTNSNSNSNSNTNTNSNSNSNSNTNTNSNTNSNGGGGGGAALPPTPPASSSSSSSPSNNQQPSGGDAGSSSPPASTSSGCGSVSITTTMRAGQSWGNPPSNVFDMAITNQGSATLTNLLISITVDTGARVDQSWNMQSSGSNYVITQSIAPGQTYNGAGFIVYGGSGTAKPVCSSGEASSNEAPPAHESSSHEAPPAQQSSSHEAPPAQQSSSHEAPPAQQSSSHEAAPAHQSSSHESAPSHSSSSPESSAGSGDCQASVQFTLSDSWQGGGRVSITVTNTGSKSITALTLSAPGVGSNAWNLQQVSDSVYTLPSWAFFQLQPGQQNTAAGYTYTGSQPAAGSIQSVSC